MSLFSYLGITLACLGSIVPTAQGSVDINKNQQLIAWKTVKSKRCSLKMPITPYASSHTNLVKGEQFNYDVLVAPVDNKAVYLLLVAEYPRAIPKNQQQTNLEQFLTWLSSQNPDNRLQSAMLVKHQGYEGMDFVIKNGNIVFSGRLVIADSRVYLMAVECEESLVTEANIGPYVGSLELF